MIELLAINVEGWKAELEDVKTNHYPKFGNKLPKELAARLETIRNMFV